MVLPLLLPVFATFAAVAIVMLLRIIQRSPLPGASQHHRHRSPAPPAACATAAPAARCAPRTRTRAQLTGLHQTWDAHVHALCGPGAVVATPTPTPNPNHSRACRLTRPDKTHATTTPDLPFAHPPQQLCELGGHQGPGRRERPGGGLHARQRPHHHASQGTQGQGGEGQMPLPPLAGDRHWLCRASHLAQPSLRDAC